MENKDLRNQKRGPAWYDWATFLLLALLCYFTMQQGDLLHTGGSSFALLNGHILDFYDYNVPYMEVNNYMLPTYILFAIWNLPIRLLGIMTVPALYPPAGVVFWYKALPVVFYFFSGYLMYRIAREMQMGDKKARLCAYVFLTTPVAFFSQFCFGQYDVFTVFFMLLGILAYVRKRDIAFILWFGIAMTFKYFALLIFIPMFLLREKNVWKIIRGLVLAVIPLLVFNLPFFGSAAYRIGVWGFGAVDYIVAVSFKNALGDTISLVIVFWAVLCGWALFERPASDRDELKWMLFLTNAVLFLVFGFGFWHPQWLLMLAPFMVLATMVSRRTDVFLILDLALMCVVCVYTVNRWPHHVDQHLFHLGLLGSLMNGHAETLTMSRLYVLTDMSLLFSLFTGVMAVSGIFRHPRYLEDDFAKPVDAQLGWVRARFLLGVGFFVVPAVVCLLYNIGVIG